MEEDPGAETTMLPSAPSSDLARGTPRAASARRPRPRRAPTAATPGAPSRPIKRSRRSSEGPSAKAMVSSLDVNEFEGVDLAGISTPFPQEKRVELAARIDASAEPPSPARAALLLAQTGMRYAEWATTPARVEATRQNTLRIVKAVVDYLTTASPPKLRRTISYIVAKRRRQGFGHEEVITSMLLLRRSFEKRCGPP